MAMTDMAPVASRSLLTPLINFFEPVAAVCRAVTATQPALGSFGNPHMDRDDEIHGDVSHPTQARLLDLLPR